MNHPDPFVLAGGMFTLLMIGFYQVGFHAGRVMQAEIDLAARTGRKVSPRL